jgi:hypothetical protein
MSDTRWAKVEACWQCWRVYKRKGHKDYCPVTEKPDHDLRTLHPNCPLLRPGDIPEVRKLREAATEAEKYITDAVAIHDDERSSILAKLDAALDAFDKGDKGEEK